MDYEIEYLTKSFESIKAKHSSLINSFESLNMKKSIIDGFMVSHEISITEMTDRTDTINTDNIEIENNKEYVSGTINRVSYNINVEVKNKGDILTKDIDTAYDKIVSIIDHYHHHL
jgi:hypothetical protein